MTSAPPSEVRRENVLRNPRTLRSIVIAAVVVLLAGGAGVLLVTGQDDEYTEEDLRGWCSIARGRDLPSMLSSGFATPRGEPIDFAGTVLTADEARALGNTTLRSMLSDTPPEISGDLDASVGVLLATYEAGTAPNVAEQDTAIQAATRAQDFIDTNC